LSRFIRPAVLGVLALTAALGVRAAMADRLVLWRIVHGQCVPAALQREPMPKPCLDVQLQEGEGGGFAVIKDINGRAQLLLIPTTPVTGIEDSRLLDAGAPDYFAAAWRARALMNPLLPATPAREDIGVTINSQFARSQDQLHLHVDCLRADVVKALADYAPHFDGQWRPMTDALQGRKYFARRVDSADLEDVEPFRLLARDMPVKPDEMAHWSLAAVPVDFADKPGFVLLADRAELTAGGHAEDLQDHDCAVVR
jgi:CDP-diacylglycerol pyrophosphatase